MIIVKVHQKNQELVLAICDKNLLGTTIEFNDAKIKVGTFYEGEEMPEEKLLELLSNATVVNAIGKKSVDFLLKNNLIEKEGVIHLGDVPHAQIFKMN